MKVLKSEFEYREWMEKDYFHLEEGYPSVLEPDELERELLHQMPDQFPCIVLVVKGPRPVEPEGLQFIYSAQVQEWAKQFGVID
ncbi:hypothetical protein [Rahnella sp. Larv3_ips]|uniref:hypothetical protein n=1 Tax=Rahnella sp. Larv3_ips TaxID=1896943 RepID=UPI000EFA4E0E|nr:hypothetical protein [Rahnella sp. Larv3_ips]